MDKILVITSITLFVLVFLSKHLREAVQPVPPGFNQSFPGEDPEEEPGLLMMFRIIYLTTIIAVTAIVLLPAILYNRGYDIISYVLFFLGWIIALSNLGKEIKSQGIDTPIVSGLVISGVYLATQMVYLTLILINGFL